MNSPRFSVPYTARIMLDMGGEFIELTRFTRKLDPRTWRAWTHGRENRCSIEEPMADRETITTRPGAKTHQKCTRLERTSGDHKRAWA